MKVGIAAGSLQSPGKSWNPKELRLSVRACLSWRDLTAPGASLRSQGILVPRPQTCALGSARPLPALQALCLKRHHLSRGLEASEAPGENASVPGKKA
ncbi:hypothetical protein mRhiFer1_009463 [Rhinolophus ferrumequinum]|uniref:Uncharacterized protein n=1 Tax=Rhinolophus ferrumequinum TaxID=59479 RepID=A0A7J7RJB3_RHIFE|nr:hypothetical protein mRhiFer1_009463 [Rhinolophus ferrumequinum]